MLILPVKLILSILEHGLLSFKCHEPLLLGFQYGHELASSVQIQGSLPRQIAGWLPPQIAALAGTSHATSHTHAWQGRDINGIILDTECKRKCINNYGLKLYESYHLTSSQP